MPDSKTLFKERQQFDQWWLWVVLIVVDLMFVFFTILGIVDHGLSAEKSYFPVVGLIALLVLIFINILVFIIRLDVEIKENGFYFRFYPFQLKMNFLPWNYIQKIYVRQYSPLLEYGGWGIRFGLFRNGQAYNIKGNIGIQVDLIDNRRVLFGTQKPKEVEKILNELFNKHQ